MENLKILILEDNLSDVELVKYELRKNGYVFTDRAVETRTDYIRALQDFIPDLILSDFSLPTFDGLQALQIRSELAPLTPFILVTGTINEETAVEIMKAGADDYVIKEHLTRLAPAVKAVLEKAAILRMKKVAEDKLRILSQTVEQNPASIILTDLEGKIEYVNTHFTESTGYELQELAGRNPRILNPGHASPEQFEEMWRKMRNGELWQGESINRKKDGTAFWEHVIISPMLDAEGKISNYIITMVDVTEKKLLLDELVKAKEKAEGSDRLKTAFIQNISHEIRTPMNAIIGFSGLINDPSLLSERRSYFSDIIVKSANQLLAIITDIMDVSTLQAGQESLCEEPTRLDEILDVLSERFDAEARSKGIKFQFDFGSFGNSFEFVSDKAKLIKVLSNLVDNSMKFTFQGHITIGCKALGDCLEFYVADTGIGIPPDMYEDIFKYFRQADFSQNRKFGGLGLGLTIAKAYIDLMKGNIHFLSKEGSGTTFYVQIPSKTPKSLTSGM